MRPRRAAAMLLLAAALAGCFGAGQPEGPLPLVRVIDTSVARPDEAFEAFDTSSMNLADLAGDGRLQLVTLNDNLQAYVIDPATGRLLAQLATTHPPNGTQPWGARDLNGVAIGNVIGDRRPELAVLNSAAILTLFTSQPGEPLGYSKAWERTANAAVLDPGFYESHPWVNATTQAIGADGNPFIAHTTSGPVLLAQSDGVPGHFGFGAQGDLRWHTSFWDGNAGPWAGTLRSGGPVMAVFATDGGQVVAYDARSGSIQWTFEAARHGARPGSIPVMVNVYDLDGDGAKEILVGPRVAVDDGSSDWMQRSHARYFLLDAAGNPRWQASFEWGNPMLYMHPAAVDANGDGTKDLVVVDWNTIGHNPGNWEKVGKANLFVLDGRNGNALWHKPIDSAWSNKGIAVGKFLASHDGPVIAVEEQVGDHDGLAFIDLKGKRRGWLPLPAAQWKITRGPVAGDIDADGRVELLVPAAAAGHGCPRPIDVGCRQGAILVYRSDAAPADVQFANNFLYDSEDTGKVPVATVAPSDAPRAKTRLDAPASASEATAPLWILLAAVALLLLGVRYGRW